MAVTKLLLAVTPAQSAELPSEFAHAREVRKGSLCWQRAVFGLRQTVGCFAPSANLPSATTGGFFVLVKSREECVALRPVA
jgi:hypothetical protein